MKRWLRRVVVAVLLCHVGRTAWLVAGRELARAEGQRGYAVSAAEAETTDPDWRWDELTAKRVRPPVGRNGMDVVLSAGALLPAEGSDAAAPHARLPADPPGPPKARLPAEVVANARGRLAAAADGVVLARTLKAYPQGYYPLVLEPNPWETKLPHIHAVRRVADALRWDAALAADAGDMALALDDADALLNLSRSVGDDPFLISQLVRVSVRVLAARHLERSLAHGEPDPVRLGAAQRAWAAEAEEPLLLHGLRGERAINDRMFANLIDGAISEPDAARTVGDPDGLFGRYAWWLHRGKLWRDRAALHDYLTRSVAVARRPVQEQPAALAAMPPPPPEELKLAALFTPAVEKCATACWRSTAQCRAVAAALACERFRRARGRWPDTLGDLVPAFLPAVPLDPFDGRPLRSRRLTDGFVVYSVGTNRQDDGGDTVRPESPGAPCPDEGFRLWDASARGVPPAAE